MTLQDATLWLAIPAAEPSLDPLKMSNIPGNIWVRGSIAQSSDLRPPLGIEIKIQNKNILAVRKNRASLLRFFLVQPYIQFTSLVRRYFRTSAPMRPVSVRNIIR